MKLLVTSIIIALSPLIYGQQVSDNTNIVNEIAGKWAGHKSEQLSGNNELLTYENKDTIILTSDFNYTWIFRKERISGKWEIDSSTLPNSKTIERKFIFKHDDVTDMMSIHKLTKDSLVLRFFDCNTKSDIDFYFNKSK